MSTDFDFDKAVEPFKTASDVADDKLRGVLTKVSQWRSVAVLSAMALLTLVMPLVNFKVGEPFSPDFWFDAAYSLAISSMSYYIFTPFGMRSERLGSKTYENAVKWWSGLSDRVRDEGLIEIFHKFCSVRCVEEREEMKALFIAAAGLPRSIYDEKYAHLTKKQLKIKKKSGELTRRQLKYLKAANGEIKVLPINPSMILSGIKVNNINDVGREKKFSVLGLLRPATLVITMAIRSIINIVGAGGVGVADYITQAAVDLFIIVMWSFNGFRYGSSLVKTEEQIVRGRSEFISMFFERVQGNKPTDGNNAEESPT